MSASGVLNRLFGDRRTRRQNRISTRKRLLAQLRSIHMESLEPRWLMATDTRSYTDFNPGAAGTTLIEIGGPHRGQELDGFDYLQVANEAFLAGTLKVELVNGYVPEIGDAFQFMTVGQTISGQFETGLGLFPFETNDRYFDVVVTDSSMSLVVKAMPTPDLEFDPNEGAAGVRDALGEVLSSYFQGDSFTYSGELNVADFFSISGSVAIGKQYKTLTLADGSASNVEVEVLTIGGSDLSAFVGSQVALTMRLGCS